MSDDRRSSGLDSGFQHPLFDPEAQGELAAALERKSDRSDPAPHVLRAAAAAYRRAGNHGRAMALYRRLLDLPGADSIDRYLCAVLEDRPWEKPGLPDRTVPSPWVVVQDLLSPVERERLLSFYLDHENRFRRPTVKFGEEERELTFLKAPIDKDANLCAAFHDALGDVCSRRFAAAIGPVANRFGIEMPALDGGDLNFYLLAYQTGNLFPPHVDHVEPEGSRRLALNAVYTFWREPRRFVGGDLLLFDTNGGGTAYDAASYSRISPIANALVIFPSDRYHAVTAIRCADDTFASGRFVLTGALLRESGADTRRTQSADLR